MKLQKDFLLELLNSDHKDLEGKSTDEVKEILIKRIKYRSSISLMSRSDSEKTLKAVKFLLGNYDRSLKGSILGFKKGWRKYKSDQDYFAFLLYFSHETGLIERHLFNLGSTKSVTLPNEITMIQEELQKDREHNRICANEPGDLINQTIYPDEINF